VENKKGQHHVWRHYISSWANSNKVWTLVRSKVLSPQSTEDVGKKRYMYKVVPPTLEEHNLAKKFYQIDKMSPERKRMAEGWIKPFELLYYTNELKEKGYVESEETIEEINYQLNNMEEDLHSSFEKDALKYFTSFKENDFTIIEDDDNRVEFCFFVALQFFRTLRNKNAMLRVLTHEGVKQALDKTWNWGKFIFANNIGYHLYKGSITIYTNITTLPFITSDQPVINLDATYMFDGTPPETMRLYYPISPDVAIVFENGDKEVYRKSLDDYYLIEKYNDLMHNWAENHTFANHEIMLKKFIEK
jgi:hypothetical protein